MVGTPPDAFASACFAHPTNLLLPLLLAGGVAGVAGGLAFGFERHFAGGGFFLLAEKLSRGFCGEPFFLGLLCGPLGLAGFLGLGAGRSLRFALGLALLDPGIVRARLGAELVQNRPLGLLGCFL